MPKQIKCPNCGRGTLEKLSREEKRNADLDLKEIYYGCDECKYAILEEEL